MIRKSLPIGLFLLMGLNLTIAPVVYAASDELARKSAYAIGLLGLVTVGLAAYLMFVIVQPERF